MIPQPARPSLHFFASPSGVASPPRGDPRRELVRGEPREGEREVSDVSLRVDREDGNPLLEQLLDQEDPERGLAAAGHPDDEAVRHQVVGVERERRRRPS